jgi:hypothetical protein
MEWMAFIGCIVWILVLVLFFPALFAPRCPDCSARLERGEDQDRLVWKGWYLGTRRFYCPRCTYAHQRPIIRHMAEKVNHETSETSTIR